jgi:hypothetical protein
MILNTILLPIKRWKINRMRPVLKFHDNTIITREIDLRDQEGNKIPFFVNRIAVSNSGKSVAKDCQIYIEFAQNNIKQVAWALTNCDTSLSITIDVEVPRQADLCAITQDGYFRRVVKEHGLKECTVDETVPLPGQQDVPAVIKIISSNAKPMERKIIFHANFIPDENNPGKIVEFQ